MIKTCLVCDVWSVINECCGNLLFSFSTSSLGFDFLLCLSNEMFGVQVEPIHQVEIPFGEDVVFQNEIHSVLEDFVWSFVLCSIGMTSFVPRLNDFDDGSFLKFDSFCWNQKFLCLQKSIISNHSQSKKNSKIFYQANVPTDSQHRFVPVWCPYTSSGTQLSSQLMLFWRVWVGADSW